MRFGRAGSKFVKSFAVVVWAVGMGGCAKVETIPDPAFTRTVPLDAPSSSFGVAIARDGDSLELALRPGECEYRNDLVTF